MNKKFKNYGLWISIASLIPLLIPDSLPPNYNEVVKAILGVLVLAGIISNPSKGKGYSDKL